MDELLVKGLVRLMLRGPFAPAQPATDCEEDAADNPAGTPRENEILHNPVQATTSDRSRQRLAPPSYLTVI